MHFCTLWYINFSWTKQYKANVPIKVNWISLTTGSKEPTNWTFVIRQLTSASIWREAGQKVHDHLQISQSYAASVCQRDWNWTNHQCENEIEEIIIWYQIRNCQSTETLKSNFAFFRSNPSLYRWLFLMYGKGERFLQTSMWTWTMKRFVRCSEAVPAGQGPQVQGSELRRTACALLLRRSLGTVTSARTWSSGCVFPSRCKKVSLSDDSFYFAFILVIICFFTQFHAGHFLSD